MIITPHDKDTHNQQKLEESQNWVEFHGRFIPITALTGMGIIVGMHKIYPQASMWLVIGLTLIISFPVGMIATKILHKFWPITLKYRD